MLSACNYFQKALSLLSKHPFPSAWGWLRLSSKESCWCASGGAWRGDTGVSIPVGHGRARHRASQCSQPCDGDSSGVPGAPVHPLGYTRGGQDPAGSGCVDVLSVAPPSLQSINLSWCSSAWGPKGRKSLWEAEGGRSPLRYWLVPFHGSQLPSPWWGR